MLLLIYNSFFFFYLFYKILMFWCIPIHSTIHSRQSKYTQTANCIWNCVRACLMNITISAITKRFFFQFFFINFLSFDFIQISMHAFITHTSIQYAAKCLSFNSFCVICMYIIIVNVDNNTTIKLIRKKSKISFVSCLPTY